MAAKKPNPFLKHKSLEDIFDYMEKDQSKDIDSAFKSMDEFEKKENENHYFNNIVNPAMDEMYKAFSSEMKKNFKNDTDKVKDKHKELRKAAVLGLKKFFEKASPGILKIDELKGLKDDDEKTYKILVGHYDRITAAGQGSDEEKIGLNDLIEGFSKDGEATSGDLLRSVYGIKDTHAAKSYSVINNAFFNHHFSKYQHTPHKVGAYIKKLMSERNGKVTDPATFARNTLNDYVEIRKGLVHGKYSKKTNTEKDYGYKIEAPKKPS